MSKGCFELYFQPCKAHKLLPSPRLRTEHGQHAPKTAPHAASTAAWRWALPQMHAPALKPTILPQNGAQPSPDKSEQAAGGNARTASLHVIRVRKDCTGGVGHVVHASKVGVYLRSVERTLTGIVIASPHTSEKKI